MKKNKKKKVILSIIIFVIVVVSVFVIIYTNLNRGSISTEGIKLNYRIYTKNGWSRWYKNGQTAGTPNESILAIEAKVDSDKYGNILYNIYSSKEDFEDNDSYNGETAGDKEKGIYGIKMFLTDDLYSEYQIYYRTHNKKDGWLDWTSRYNISGDNEVEIDQIQIKILKIDDKFEQDIEKASIGF